MWLRLRSHGRRAKTVKDSIFLKYVVKDNRFKDKSLDELKLLRANMHYRGARDYDLACVQYWIMLKENRLPGGK